MKIWVKCYRNIIGTITNKNNKLNLEQIIYDVIIIWSPDHDVFLNIIGNHSKWLIIFYIWLSIIIGRIASGMLWNHPIIIMMSVSLRSINSSSGGHLMWLYLMNLLFIEYLIVVDGSIYWLKHSVGWWGWISINYDFSEERIYKSM